MAGDNTLFGVRIGTGFTQVDDIYQPHTGHVVRLVYEQVTGDFTFGLLTASAVQYFTLYEDVLGRKTVLAAKVQGGTVAGGDAPPFEKFYGGGMGLYSIRGFDYRGISTRGLQVFDPPEPGDPPLPAPRKVDPIGSDYILVGNTEVIIPLIGENFSALTFADTGIIDTGSWRFSVGSRHPDPGSTDPPRDPDAVRIRYSSGPGGLGREQAVQFYDGRPILKSLNFKSEIS